MSGMATKAAKEGRKASRRDLLEGGGKGGREGRREGGGKASRHDLPAIRVLA